MHIALYIALFLASWYRLRQSTQLSGSSFAVLSASEAQRAFHGLCFCIRLWFLRLQQLP